jgi:hypothetical protein
MKAKELCDEIRSYCRENADDAVVKKYAKYFKEGHEVTKWAQQPDFITAANQDEYPVE